MAKKQETLNMDQVLKQAVNNPLSANVDGQSISQHNLKDLIEFDRYMESKKASRGKKLGIRLFKVQRGGYNE